MLPTGLGKTVIAMLAAAERLKAYPNGRVILLASTRPLAHQHYESFRETLNLHSSDFTLLTGENPPEKRKSCARIVFSTPQALENDVLAGRATPRDVVLMVFDEAHRAVGNYPYVFLAEQYVRSVENPLILALTASPGSDREQVEEVNETSPSGLWRARTDLSPDVKPYVKAIRVEWMRVRLEGLLEEATSLLKEYVRERVKNP